MIRGVWRAVTWYADPGSSATCSAVASCLVKGRGTVNLAGYAACCQRVGGRADHRHGYIQGGEAPRAALQLCWRLLATSARMVHRDRRSLPLSQLLVVRRDRDSRADICRAQGLKPRGPISTAADRPAADSGKNPDDRDFISL